MMPAQQMAATLFQRAVACHQAHDLGTAATLYRQILDWSPDHADALHLLGVVAYQTDDQPAALDLITRAIRLRPRTGAYHESLGKTLKAAGRLDEAVAALRKAVRLAPGEFGPEFNLGNALYALEQHAEAAQCFRRAIRVNPRIPDAHNNLGNACRALGKLEDAAAAFRAAIALQPRAAELHYNLAAVLAALKRDADAVAALDAALRLQPDHLLGHTDRALALERLGRHADALPSFRAVARLRPGDADTLVKLAEALQCVGQYQEALDVASEAVRLAPGSVDAHGTLGALLRDVGDIAGSLARFEHSRRLAPDHANVRFGIGMTKLLAGRLAEAWDDYEERFKAQGIVPRCPEPVWQGEPAHGQVLFLWAEQGLGDVIQMLRFVPLAAQRTRVVLEVPAPLRALAASLAGPERIIVPGDPVPPHALHCPLWSLPRAFGTTLATIPAAVPYLHADPARVAAWRERLAGLPGRRIGLVWQGNRDYRMDGVRSIPLPVLAPLAAVPGVAFVSLQKGEQDACPDLPVLDVSDGLTDMAETAALIAALDLVIGVDTGVVHLAGALGRPVWLLNRSSSDWRWLLGRDDSPWYPTLRQFRQTAPGDWPGVIGRVREALAGWAESPPT